MAFQAQWDSDEKNIIRYDASGRWTTAEFWQAYQAGKQMIDTVDNQVDFIVHMTDAISRGHMPSGFMMHLASIYRNAHPRAGRTIVVPKTAGLMGEIWERMVRRNFPQIIKHFDFVETLEEARMLLERTRVK